MPPPASRAFLRRWPPQGSGGGTSETGRCRPAAGRPAPARSRRCLAQPRRQTPRTETSMACSA
eukprot:scaffold33235_cov101-Isochrysis_galbana.AAC.2